MTATLQFMIPAPQSEYFNTAFYEFAELRFGIVGADTCELISEPHGPLVRKTVTLPADQNILDFARYWSAYRRERVGGPGLGHRSWRIDGAGDPALV